MIYTKQIKKAISFSIQVHETDQKQKRKGKDIAYIVHPLGVGLILARSGASEEVIVAGILHDTLEDSIAEKKISMEMLVQEFGEPVANLVSSVTEHSKELPWEIRKQQAIEHVKSFSHDSLLVKSADIISNASELIEDYEKMGDDVFARFNAPKGKILKNYLETITAIIVSWSDSPLVKDLQYIAQALRMIGATDFMTQFPAEIIEYSDYNENATLECPVCHWKGTPKESDCVNTDSHFALDVSCPVCDKMLLVASYPSA